MLTNGRVGYVREIRRKGIERLIAIGTSIFLDNALSLSSLASDTDYWGICCRLTLGEDCETLQWKQRHRNSPVRKAPPWDRHRHYNILPGVQWSQFFSLAWHSCCLFPRLPHSGLTLPTFFLSLLHSFIHPTYICVSDTMLSTWDILLNSNECGSCSHRVPF